MLDRLDVRELAPLFCQQVYERTNDTEMLGKVFGARAHLDSLQNHVFLDIGFQEPHSRSPTATTTSTEPGAATTTWPAACWTQVHHPACGSRTISLLAVINYAVQGPTAARDFDNFAESIRRFGDRALDIRPTFRELAARVDKVPGVGLASLIMHITGEPGWRSEELYVETCGWPGAAVVARLRQ